MICLFLFALPLLASHSHGALLHPIILVPGDGGCQIEGRLDKPTVVHYLCSKQSDWFDLWLNLEQMLPLLVDCWVDNMKLKYDPLTRSTSNNDGVETRIPGFGNTTTVEWIDKSQRSFSEYFASIVRSLLPKGYQRGVNIHGAPYDFRRAANEQGEYFAAVKELIESTYKANSNIPVILVCHSLGSPMMLFFLNRQSQAWKDQHIRGLMTLAGPWGGTARALKVFAVGDNLGWYLLNEKKLMWEQRSSSSLAWLMPQSGFWEETEILVQTEHKNYSISNYGEFFHDLDEPNAWMLAQDTRDLLAGLPSPGVEVFCLHGAGVKSTEKLIYAPGEFPGKDPEIVLGDGDGTVNVRSLMGCTRWMGKQAQPVHHHVLPGVDHAQILWQPGPVELITRIIDTINGQLGGCQDAIQSQETHHSSIKMVDGLNKDSESVDSRCKIKKRKHSVVIHAIYFFVFVTCCAIMFYIFCVSDLDDNVF